MLQQALQYHQAGQFSQAEVLYRQMLQEDPKNSQVLHLLGLIAAQHQDYSVAEELITKAIRLDDSVPDFYNNLGNVLNEQGKLAQATTCYQRALTFNPNDVEACNNLGSVLTAQGKLTEATTYYQRALSLNPNLAEIHNNLGSVLRRLGQLEKAVACYQRALALSPQAAEVHYNLGNVFRDQGQFEEAVTCYQRASAFRPNDAETYNSLGCALIELGNLTEAMVHCQRALTLKPDFTEASSNLGIILFLKGMITQAIAQCKTSLNLSTAFNHGNFLPIWLYTTDYEPTTIFWEHQQFNERYAIPLATSIQPHLNTRVRRRQLKIGYLSGDFRRHSVAYFIEPILVHHDPRQVEIFCYSNHILSDDVTQRLQSYGNHWQNCVGLSDDALADTIRQNQIDILVELSGHTGGNRLLVLARKPAPIQVTYLGYPYTTGLTAIDYRLTDEYVDTPGVNEQFNSETLVKLPASFFCYQPYEDSPPVSRLPALDQGYLTFSSFNSYPKVNSYLFEMWAEILGALPAAKLLMQTKSLQDKETREDFLAQMARLGVSEERLIITQFTPPPEYLRTYHQVDIALDCYPFNGGTTTCEALWMGIPVVTLVGTRQVSRLGLSILATLGLTDLIAYTPQDYVNICLKLANNLDYLQTLRATMRDRMQTSPLMDAASFTRHLEGIYRQMWEKWCNNDELRSLN
jgi:predicted O-linked N-acetylglucosamine transferase (SPINDLY family)